MKPLKETEASIAKIQFILGLSAIEPIGTRLFLELRASAEREAQLPSIALAKHMRAPTRSSYLPRPDVRYLELFLESQASVDEVALHWRSAP